MKKTFFIALVVAALVGAIALPNLMASAIPGDMILKAPEGMKVTKAPVAFPHGKHAEDFGVDCMICHHKAESKDAIKSCAAAGCHDQPGKKGANTFYQAYHNKKVDASCVACHKKEKKAGKKNVPVACKDCHPKKKK